MPLIIPPGFAQISIPFKHASMARKAYVTFGIDMAPGETLTPVVCNQIGSAWNGAWSTFMDDQVTLGPVVGSAGQDGGENLSVEGTSTFTGAANSERVMANTALLIKKVTARGGRRGRGRFYLPWHLAESAVDETGAIAGASVTSCQTAATALLTAIAALSAVDAMVVLHSTGGTPTGPPDTITALVVDPVVGTQRRRLGR